MIVYVAASSDTFEQDHRGFDHDSLSSVDGGSRCHVRIGTDAHSFMAFLSRAFFFFFFPPFKLHFPANKCLFNKRIKRTVLCTWKAHWLRELASCRGRGDEAGFGSLSGALWGRVQHDRNAGFCKQALVFCAGL